MIPALIIRNLQIDETTNGWLFFVLTIFQLILAMFDAPIWYPFLSILSTCYINALPYDFFSFLAYSSKMCITETVIFGYVFLSWVRKNLKPRITIWD
jgi:hypothetical protein